MAPLAGLTLPPQPKGMGMKKVLLTDDEIEWANQLLDIALKQVGRQAIPPFVAVVNKLAAAENVEDQAGEDIKGAEIN